MPPGHPFAPAIEAELALPRTLVSFNGSVIENYPHYLTTCQRAIDGLMAPSGDDDDEDEGGLPGALDLVAAKESSLLGAAVALACLEAE